MFLMNLDDEKYRLLLGSDESTSGKFDPPLINIGVGTDVTIAELADLIRNVVGFSGAISYDATKPDGTPRKLMDVTRINSIGWHSTTSLTDGLHAAYRSFLAT